MHQACDPSILYFGTPVVLISTKNPDGTDNLAPVSSAFWLGWRCMIGISALSRTTENLLRTRQCVLNLPSVREAGAVNRLALTTGSNPIPPGKIQKGYGYVPDKFGHAGLSAGRSELVEPPRVMECPVQMESELIAIHPVADESELQRGKILALELKVLRVHLENTILMEGYPNRVDPDKWRPLIMSFQEFYGLGEKVHDSRLGTISESLYRTPDIMPLPKFSEQRLKEPSQTTAQ